jgi:pectate lyase
MKTLLALLVLNLVLVPASRASLAFEEHFPYTTGNLGTVGTSGGWSGSNSGVTVTTNSLDGSALDVPTATGNKVTTTTSSSSGTYNQFSSGIKTNSVYYSFLLRVNSTAGLDSTGKLITGILRQGSASSYYNDVWLRLNGSNLEIGLSKVRNGTTWYSTPLATGTVYFIVTKYQFGPSSGDDVVALWVNPATGATNEPAANVSFSTGGDGNNSTGIGRCYLYGGMTVDVDEIRIGTNWAEVTPTAEPLPPTPLSAPVITNATATVDGFVISGTNGPANANYDVLSSGDLAVPFATWTLAGTDSFDTHGNFTFIHSTTFDAAQKFYVIRVTDTNPPPVAPEITAQPQDTTNLLGNSATFSVTATGTAPLRYQWYFNETTRLTNATSATLTLNNLQFSDAGGYSVVITNIAGAVSSIVAQLTVTNTETPPFIITQPQNKTVAQGQTVNFSVTAGGTVPLAYQWYFNDTTPLDGQTNALLTLTNVSLADEGGYSVAITNLFGATNSAVATLTIDTNAAPDFGPIGFCNQGGTITGGAAGPVVYVGSEAELQTYSQVSAPYVIYITNSFTLSGMSTHIYPNKTVIGFDGVVLSGGGLYLYRSTNTIIRNLTIRSSTEDNIGVHFSDHVWIDHCTFYDATDGQLDITQSSDYLTISWCKFFYTDNPPAGDHRFVSLIASSDADNGSQYHVTYHHNWWSTNCIERMPSVRFGRVHVFNDYYSAPGNNYCVRTRIEAECRVENNFFENVKNPWEQYITGSTDTQGKLFAANNNVPFLGTDYGVTWTGTTNNKDGTIRAMIPGTDTVFTPSYSYTLDAASAVPDLARNYAGAGKGPFAP